MSCLQSRLNDMDMMAGVVRQRIDIVISLFMILSSNLSEFVGGQGFWF